MTPANTSTRRASSRLSGARQVKPRTSPTHDRARLRVVPKGYKTKSARQRHARRILAATSVSVCAILFGVLALQVMITQGQFRLQKLNHAAYAKKEQFISLRAQVGQLESPARIIAEAKNRLGMIGAPPIHYLKPVRAVHTEPEAQVTDSLNEWASLKELQAFVP